jgi:hypothetical protein
VLLFAVEPEDWLGITGLDPVEAEGAERVGNVAGNEPVLGAEPEHRPAAFEDVADALVAESALRRVGVPVRCHLHRSEVLDESGNVNDVGTATGGGARRRVRSFGAGPG